MLAGISGDIQRLLVTSERYHARAEQREGVIDHLRAEVDRLRRGERRGMLRPLLVEMCRLRNDLLRQAEDLPGDFDADRARLLLRSYADSVELALEDDGVVTFTPEKGDRFEPRMHRRVGGDSQDDPGAGRPRRPGPAQRIPGRGHDHPDRARRGDAVPAAGGQGELPAAQQAP